MSAIFLGEPPIPASLLYDITQYTYLEKRLLVRKSIEISDTLKGSLSPAVLLHLYLLSLRDDLSNENVQLIALIMKNCFPAQEVRTRIGGTSLEEYGEIARAWKNAEKRSLDLEINRASGAEGRGARAFDRDSASYFLDKYFSDEALSEMRASAPLSPSRRVPPKGAFARKADTGPGAIDETRTVEPSPRAAEPVRHRARAPEPAGRPPGESGRVHGKARADERDRRPRCRPRGDREDTRNGGRGLCAHPVPREGTRENARLGLVARRGTRHPGSPRGWRGRAAPPCLAASPERRADRDCRGGGGRDPRRGAGGLPSGHRPRDNCACGCFRRGRAAGRSGPVAEAPVAPAAAVPSRTTYVVRPGDSLWKIFGSLRAGNPDRAGWTDFLSRARSLNGLDDPDQLQPGKVLTLSVQK